MGDEKCKKMENGCTPTMGCKSLQKYVTYIVIQTKVFFFAIVKGNQMSLVRGWKMVRDEKGLFSTLHKRIVCSVIFASEIEVGNTILFSIFFFATFSRKCRVYTHVTLTVATIMQYKLGAKSREVAIENFSSVFIRINNLT